MSKKFFFIGIKGAGMTPLARVLKKQGHYVVGSDVESHIFTQDFLDEFNINYYNFDEYQFDSDYTVIIGNSFKEDFSEVKRAIDQGNERYYYFEYLGKLSKDMSSIAVTGTHGKTTTTTMIKDIFSFEKPISYLVGDGNGDSDLHSNTFIFEACEYRNHFHSYFPNYAVITNIDLDHLDFFENQKMYNESFIKFSENVKDKIIVCGDDVEAYNIFKNNEKAIFYGFNDYCDYQIVNCEYLETGCKFTIKYNDLVFDFDVAIFGKHNVLNFTASIVCAHLYGLNIENINKSYVNIKTAKRRFEEYIYEEQIVIDDYAHHPDELKAFLDAVFQKYPNKEVVAVFEPHTVSRLQEHYKAFANELNRCSEQIILKVEVPLRDKMLYGDDHLESDIMINHLKNGLFNPDNLNDYLKNKRNCIVLFIGATISKYSEKYICLTDLHFVKK